MDLTPEVQELLIIIGGLLAALFTSETLPYVGKIKSNGIAQLLVAIIKAVAKGIANYNPTRPK